MKEEDSTAPFYNNTNEMSEQKDCSKYELNPSSNTGSHSHTYAYSIDHHLIKALDDLRRWNFLLIRPNADSTHSNCIEKINRICMLLHLPQHVASAATVVYQQFERMNGSGNKSTICIVAAAVYLACMGCSLPCTIEEIVGKIAIQRGNNRCAYLMLAYEYCKVMLIQNILANVLPHYNNDCHYYFCHYDQLYLQYKRWQYLLLQHIEEKLLVLSRKGLPH